MVQTPNCFVCLFVGLSSSLPPTCITISHFTTIAFTIPPSLTSSTNTFHRWLPHSLSPLPFHHRATATIVAHALTSNNLPLNQLLWMKKMICYGGNKPLINETDYHQKLNHRLTQQEEIAACLAITKLPSNKLRTTRYIKNQNSIIIELNENISPSNATRIDHRWSRKQMHQVKLVYLLWNLAAS